tara:strand:+ start:433 stop:777 length:345 start_codon:yes stop_codon:yes gene_type:complete
MNQLEKIDSVAHQRHELQTKLYYDATIYSIIKHVSISGMLRHISFFHIWANEPHFITYSISKVCDYKMNKQHDGLLVRGCGMDMAWSVVNHLEYELNKDQEYLDKPFKLKSRII